MRFDEIKKSLFPVVGWMQDFNPASAIDEELTKTESGLYFQSAHPLLTLKNIRATMPEEYGLRYAEWSEMKTYKEGDKVRHNSIVYEARQTSIGEEPSASDFNGDFSRDYDNPYWRPYNFFSDYLATLTEGAIGQAVQRFVTEKQLNKETRNLLELRTFFDGTGNLNDTIRNTGKLCGFEINNVRSNGVTTKIEKVGLQFTGNVDLTLYLFHSSDNRPVKTFDISYTGNGRFQWFILNECFMPYKAENNAGGSWFLCYNQNDLPEGVRAVNFRRDWSREPCGTCNRGSLENWRELTKYIMVTPFEVHAPTTFKEYPEMWDLDERMNPNTLNFGMNCSVSVMCDLTDIIIEQRHIFANVIQLQTAYSILRLMALNPEVRVNRNQTNINRNELLYELDGDGGKRASGIGAELDKAYKALRIDTQNLDRICLACNNGGVRYRTV